MTIRQQLVRLVSLTLLPAALCILLLIAYAMDRQHALIDNRTLNAAHALAHAVDLELARHQAALLALATSPHLAAGDLAAFHGQARQAQRDLDGDMLVLSDAAGRQLLDSQQPHGAALPPRADLSQARRVFETGKPSISDLFDGATVRRPLVAIEVPVRLPDGRVAYSLAMGVFPERLAGVLQRQDIPSGWVVTLFDGQGRIVARTRAADRFVGQKGPPVLVARMAQAAKGRVETDTLEGIPVAAVYSRSAMSGWSVAIGIPRGTLFRKLWMPIGGVIAGALVLLASGIAVALRLGTRISRSIRGLIPPAVALGHGDPFVVPALRLREADDVGRELVNASARLHERERTLALVSHDLRSPIGAIIMGAGVIAHLAGRIPGGEPIRVLAGAHAEVARRMSGMVDDLLAISVATSGGRSMLNLAPVGAATLLQRAAQAAVPAFGKAGIALDVEVVGTLPGLRADSDRLMRVFANLLDNALKFTEPGGQVVLRALAQPGGVRYCVANSGPAVPDTELDNLFKAFWQAAGDDRRGAGLGLSICRSIVEAHGGRIWAEAETGKRVCICFTLPSAADAADA